MLAEFSIIAVPFLVTFAAVTVLAIVMALLLRHRARMWVQISVWILVVALVALNALGWVNRHYAYMPTLQDLFGRTAADESTVADVEHQTEVPTTGKVITIPIPGTTSGFVPRDALVYLPPAWFERPRPKLPVIVLLPGTPGATDNWTQGGFADVTSDAYAAQHGGRAPILVMADNNGSDTADTECVGPVEQYLTVDVPAFAKRRFGTATAPPQWAIGGLSEGGVCGLMLTLRHPEVYRTFLDFGGLLGPRSGEGNSVGSTVSDLFGGNQAEFDAHEPLDIMAKTEFPQLGGWFEVGSDDADPLAAQRELVPAATKARLTVCSVVVPGGEHTFQMWKQAFQDALPWTAARLGIGPPVRKCPHQ